MGAAAFSQPGGADSGAEGPGFKSQPRRCLRQTVHTHRAAVHQAAKLVAALLWLARTTAGLAESNEYLYFALQGSTIKHTVLQ